MTATSGDISVAQDGQGNIKLHPYLVTLVLEAYDRNQNFGDDIDVQDDQSYTCPASDTFRDINADSSLPNISRHEIQEYFQRRWCVSCLWSTATVLLHRLMTTPLQPITGPRPPLKSKAQRCAGTEHLHPEPRVECQLLHQPETHELDVIFVHGLYGSLGNTWRQGDWRSKYQSDPTKVILRNHKNKTCKCHTNIQKQNDNDNKCNTNDIYNTDLNQTEMTVKRINEKLFKKIIPKENDLITEQFYNNTLLDQVEVIDNYDTQAKFVRDLFKRENDCDIKCDANNESKCNITEINEVNECKCNDKKCEVGCGCTCDDCYSTCWPKDWIKEDFPGARVISINYTSDPYLWRPLWIKENKRLSLHVRAEQMMQQLFDMGVGDKPIVWVGHSKGGLFIKEIFCEAYEAYKKLNKNEELLPPELNNEKNTIQRSNSTNNDAVIAETIDNIVGNMFDNKQMYKEHDNMTFNDYKVQNNNTLNITRKNEINEPSAKGYSNVITNLNLRNELTINVNVILEDNENKCKITDSNGNENTPSRNVQAISSNNEEVELTRRARIFERSEGFMFYSVPHRGSPLADIKTPVTARSLELLEISKDCQLVLDLQRRWLAAGAVRRPSVRGAVETHRTLMAVLWLRIVSVHSADAGIGTLLGVSVDHREICKPSSRHCLLYTELTGLIHDALNNCRC